MKSENNPKMAFQSVDHWFDTSVNSQAVMGCKLNRSDSTCLRECFLIFDPDRLIHV